MTEFEVIGETDVLGDDDEEVEGDVLGYSGPMGNFEGGDEIVGYDDYGNGIVVGARRRVVRRKKRRPRVILSKPKWRNSQLAPGVIAPDQGMLPLPLTAPNGGVFDLANQTLTFQGTVQKPFRGERLLVSTVRTGASAVGRLMSQIFVGTDLQQLDVQALDLEQLGDPNAFGVRLTMKPVQPGVFIRIVSTLNIPIAGADTIVTSVQLLGRNVH
jgi:hypothetical protein